MANIEIPQEPQTGYEQIVMGTTAASKLSPPDLGEAQVPYTAVIQIQRNSARMRLDGIDPTPTEGMLLSAGDMITLGVQQFTKARFIAAGGSAPTLSVTYYGRTDANMLAAMERPGA